MIGGKHYPSKPFVYITLLLGIKFDLKKALKAVSGAYIRVLRETAS